MLEFARAWNLHQVMTDAAREGARRAVTGGHDGSNGQTQDSVKAAMWRLPGPGRVRPAATTGIEPIVDYCPLGGSRKETGKNITVEPDVVRTGSGSCRFGRITMRTSFTIRNE